ncbi:MAG: rSAM/selenodomain-associated transferase 1 [Halieaceae bacterium]|jgi:rSAM/selenodomain-associated transferase 1
MGDRDDRLVIQFAREPFVGKVKTRMQPELSVFQSLALHEALVEHICLSVMEAGVAAVQLWVAGNVDHPLFLRLSEAGVAGVHQQRGADLGVRMSTALHQGLSCYKKVVLVGSDCVHLDKDYLEQAFSALDACPLVFGPAADGGYVLVGVRGVVPDVFTGVQWGSAKVMEQTRKRSEMVDTVWLELDSRADIDRPSDLKLLEGVISGAW